jgi:hypothetical protein
LNCRKDCSLVFRDRSKLLFSPSQHPWLTEKNPITCNRGWTLSNRFSNLLIHCIFMWEEQGHYEDYMYKDKDSQFAMLILLLRTVILGWKGKFIDDLKR